MKRLIVSLSLIPALVFAGDPPVERDKPGKKITENRVKSVSNPPVKGERELLLKELALRMEAENNLKKTIVDKNIPNINLSRMGIKTLADSLEAAGILTTKEKEQAMGGSDTPFIHINEQVVNLARLVLKKDVRNDMFSAIALLQFKLGDILPERMQLTRNKYDDLSKSEKQRLQLELEDQKLVLVSNIKNYLKSGKTTMKNLVSILCQGKFADSQSEMVLSMSDRKKLIDEVPLHYLTHSQNEFITHWYGYSSTVCESSVQEMYISIENDKRRPLVDKKVEVADTPQGLRSDNTTASDREAGNAGANEGSN